MTLSKIAVSCKLCGKIEWFEEDRFSYIIEALVLSVVVLRSLNGKLHLCLFFRSISCYSMCPFPPLAIVLLPLFNFPVINLSIGSCGTILCIWFWGGDFSICEEEDAVSTFIVCCFFLMNCSSLLLGMNFLLKSILIYWLWGLLDPSDEFIVISTCFANVNLFRLFRRRLVDVRSLRLRLVFF